MRDKENMDKQIREKLESFTVAPPPHVFNSVQGQLAALRRKKRNALIAYISAAAVMVFAFIAGWYVNDNSTDRRQAVVNEQMILAPNTNKQQKPGNQPGNTTIASTEVIQNTKSTKPQAKTTPIKTAGKQNNYNTVATELKIEDNFVASLERISYDLMESLEAFLLTEKDVELASVKTGKHAPKLLSEMEAGRVAQNTKNYRQQKNEEKGWIVGAHLSPGYSSQTTEYSAQYAADLDYSGENGTGNMGGGISIQYKTNKRLRIESGVYYAQNSQRSANSPNRLFAANPGFDYLIVQPENAKITGPEPSFSNTVRTGNEGISMNSTAGVINMETTPKGASVSAYGENLNAGTSNTLTTNGAFSQEFEFVEIPFYLRYSLLNKKFGIEVLGGINAGVVVGNNAYIDNNFGKQNVGSTEDISSLNFSGTLGLGLNYGLGKHFSLAMEPRVNYYLSSINSNPDVNYKPYRIAFFTGIYYEF